MYGLPSPAAAQQLSGEEAAGHDAQPQTCMLALPPIWIKGTSDSFMSSTPRTLLVLELMILLGDSTADTRGF